MRTIDCRGLSCPQPLLMFTEANKKDSESPMNVLVDNPASMENVSRAARKKGWKVEVVPCEEQGAGVVRLELRK